MINHFNGPSSFVFLQKKKLFFHAEQIIISSVYFFLLYANNLCVLNYTPQVNSARRVE